jgi:hypothetical protein
MGLAATFAQNSFNVAQCLASAQGIHFGCDRRSIFSARAMISFPRDRALALVRPASDGQADQ